MEKNFFFPNKKPSKAWGMSCGVRERGLSELWVVKCRPKVEATISL